MKNRNTKETSRTVYCDRHGTRMPQQSAGGLERGPLDGATEEKQAESLKLQIRSGIGNTQKAGGRRTPKTEGGYLRCMLASVITPGFLLKATLPHRER